MNNRGCMRPSRCTMVRYQERKPETGRTSELCGRLGRGCVKDPEVAHNCLDMAVPGSRLRQHTFARTQVLTPRTLAAPSSVTDSRTQASFTKLDPILAPTGRHAMKGNARSQTRMYTRASYDARTGWTYAKSPSFKMCHHSRHRALLPSP